VHQQFLRCVSRKSNFSAMDRLALKFYSSKAEISAMAP